MKQVSFGLVLGFVMLAAVPSANAVVINFDDVTGTSTALTNQYASSGVLFDQIERSQSFVFNIVPPSSPNYASPFFNTANPGLIEFVDPANSSVMAYTDSVTITMVGLSTPVNHPGQFSGATIDALDIFGNAIAGQTQVIAATNTATSNLALTFTGQIHELRITQTAGTSGLLPFDDLTFGALTTVPEPSTAAAVFGALAVLSTFRRATFLRRRRTFRSAALGSVQAGI